MDKLPSHDDTAIDANDRTRPPFPRNDVSSDGLLSDGLLSDGLLSDGLLDGADEQGVRFDTNTLDANSPNKPTSVGSPADTAAAPRRKRSVRTIWISDVHLGTKDCQAKQLADFLKQHDCQRLYLVGDFIDGWKMKKNVYWKPAFTRVIRRILKLSKRGVPVVYITGNHDEFLRRYANQRFDKIHLKNRTTHISANGKRYLILHGDLFDNVTRAHRVLKWVGDWGYDFLMWINRTHNTVRANYGLGYWSLAGFLKQKIKRAQEYIEDYERSAALYAKKLGYDGIICGHIHQAALKTIEGIDYCNTGDWVESCTALIEDFDGRIELVTWTRDATQKQPASKKERKKKAVKIKTKAKLTTDLE